MALQNVSTDHLLQFVASALGDESLLLADVGSIGGAHDRWTLVGDKLKVLQFDPRESGDGVPETTRSQIVHQVALASSAGTETLNVLQFGNLSSFLQPNVALMRLFFKARNRIKIVDQKPIVTSTLDRIAKDNDYHIDALKIDTQGTELAIANGAATCLATTVLFVEVEVSFFERYVGQPSFADICDAMNRFGFELLDLYQLRRYQYHNEHNVCDLHLKSWRAKSGRLAYANALFVVREDALAKRILSDEGLRTDVPLRKLMAILAVYGKLDFAASLAERHASSITETDCLRLFSPFIAKVGG